MKKTHTHKCFSALLLLVLSFTMSLPTHAVLKEKDLAATLKVLRAELQSTYNEQKQHLARYNTLTQMQRPNRLNALLSKAGLYV